MDPLCWTMQRARPLTTPERALLQERYAAGWRGRFELYLAMAGPVVATGCHPSGDLDEVLHEVGDTAGHLGADVRAGDRAHWPQPVVAATELMELPERACADVLRAADRGEPWADRALARFGPDDIVNAWLEQAEDLFAGGMAAGWLAAASLGPESVAPRVLARWDAADDRHVRARLVPLLQMFMEVPAVEDRMARDYLYSLRAGDRHLAHVLEVGSPRVRAAYAQVILRRMRRGRGLARYAVRHLAQRGDGRDLLRGVLVSKHFGPKDKLAVLAAHPDRGDWAASLPQMAEAGILPPTDDEGLAACLVHPLASVRHLARRTLSLEGKPLPLPRGTWSDTLVRWGVTDPEPDAVAARAEQEGEQLLETHGRWLLGLKELDAATGIAPSLSRRVEVTIHQEWGPDWVRLRVAPAPAPTKPRLQVTLRDEAGHVVDVMKLAPVRFHGTVAVFEVWRVGRREATTSLDAKLLE